MKKHIVIAISTLTALLIILSGCGKSESRKSELMEETYAAAVDYAVPMAAKGASYGASYNVSYSDALGTAEAGIYYNEKEADTGSEQAADADRYSLSDKKLIRTINVSLETEEYDTVNATIKKKVKEFGGYIESCNEYRGSYQSMSNRSTDMTLRIPAEKTDAFLQSSFDKAYVTSMNENTQDVTLQYSDLSTRKKSLEAERDRLLQLIEKAEDIKSIIALEERLTNVRYELESIETSLRSYDNKVIYSTVWISLNEVRRIVPAEEASFAEKIKSGFIESSSNFLKMLAGFVIWFISNILSILFFAGIVFLIIKAVRKIRKGTKISSIGRQKEHTADKAERPDGKTDQTEEKK